MALDDDEWNVADDGYWDFDEVPLPLFLKFRHIINWGETNSGRETLQRFTEMKGEHYLKMSFDRYQEIIEDHDARIPNDNAPAWQQEYQHDFYADADYDADDDDL